VTALVGSYAAWAATLACTVAIIAVAGRVATPHSCGIVSPLTVEVFLAASAGTVALQVVIHAGAGWVQVAVAAAVLVGLPVLLGSRERRRDRRDRDSYRVTTERYSAADAAAAAGIGDGR